MLFLKTFRYTLDVQMSWCWTGYFRRPHKSAEMLSVLGMLTRSMVMSFIPGQSSGELILLTHRCDWKPCVQAWHGTAPELTYLLPPRELMLACEGSWRYVRNVLWIGRYKHYMQLCTGCSNSTEVSEGSLYFHWSKWKQKHLPFHLKHCTVALCHFLALHFADTVYKPGLCLF